MGRRSATFPLARSALVTACLLLATACSRSAMLVDESAPTSTTSSSATTTSTGTGGAPPAPPDTIVFQLTFISDIPESIFVNETDFAWLSGHWLTIYYGNGALLRKAPRCEICSCDECPNCPICGAPCPTVTEIQAPGQVEWLWSGHTYPEQACPADETERCQASVPAAPGSYTAQFCWGTSFTGTLPCPADIFDEHCAEVSFTYPDADGLVEYVLNNSG